MKWYNPGAAEALKALIPDQPQAYGLMIQARSVPETLNLWWLAFRFPVTELAMHKPAREPPDGRSSQPCM